MAAPKVYSVLWADAAESDLNAIADYLAAESVDAAADALSRLMNRAARLRSLPYRGRVVPELAAHGISDYRELQLHPWRVIYRIEGGAVRVLAVLDGRRSLEDLLLARFLR